MKKIMYAALLFFGLLFVWCLFMKMMLRYIFCVEVGPDLAFGIMWFGLMFSALVAIFNYLENR